MRWPRKRHPGLGCMRRSADSARCPANWRRDVTSHTYFVTSSWLSPRASRSSHCEGSAWGNVGSSDRSRSTVVVQNAQSPSKMSSGPLAESHSTTSLTAQCYAARCTGSAHRRGLRARNVCCARVFRTYVADSARNLGARNQLVTFGPTVCHAVYPRLG